MSADRIRWPDYLKGIAILFVVVAHVLRGLVNNNILALSPFISYIDSWIYAFHMPAFFFASGIFVSKSAAGKTILQFAENKFRVIMYPYLLWSTVQIVIMMVVSGSTTHSIQWIDILRITYKPVMQFWFFYALFLMLIIFIVMYKLNVKPFILLLFSIFLYAAPNFVPMGPWGMVYIVSGYMVYFACGAGFSKLLLSRLPGMPTKTLSLSTLIMISVLSLLVYVNPEPGPVIKVLSALCGIGWLVALSEVMSRYKYLNVFRDYGVVSLNIYVAHTIAAAASRIVFQRFFGISDVMLHIIIGVFAGVYAPILLTWISSKLKMPYLFTLPVRPDKYKSYL